MEMNQRLNLLLGRLEEGEANVFVHDIDLFVHLGADVSQTVRVRLESARLATAATGRMSATSTSLSGGARAQRRAQVALDELNALRAFGFLATMLRRKA